MFGVWARLGPRIMPLDDATGKPKHKPSDYELWLECRNCGTVYAKHDTKVEAVIEPLVQTKTNPFDKGKIQSIGQMKKRKRGNNPRLKATRDDWVEVKELLDKFIIPDKNKNGGGKFI